MTAAGAEVGSTTRVAETIHGILEAAAEVRPSSPYFVAADGSFTTGQTAVEVERVARMLAAAGLRTGTEPSSGCRTACRGSRSSTRSPASGP